MSGDNNINLPELNPEDFGYLSARDIDADGTNDLIHGVDHDGNAHVFHLDGKGDITLEEIDTDGDGTFETQREMVDGDTVAYTVTWTTTAQLTRWSTSMQRPTLPSSRT